MGPQQYMPTCPARIGVNGRTVRDQVSYSASGIEFLRPKVSAQKQKGRLSCITGGRKAIA
ncbi:hypothetical protein BC2230_40239 [Burkholderia cepacia]